jgi:hypothetical protein
MASARIEPPDPGSWGAVRLLIAHLNRLNYHVDEARSFCDGEPISTLLLS